MNIGVIGCGMISDIFIENMQNTFGNTKVVACSARHLENAQKKAAQYGMRAATNEEIFADPTIEMVVVLTGAAAHYDIIKAALLAGKHVYTEKTMTVTLEESAELVALARERGLYLGASPDTFLAPAFQAAKAAIAEGKIGEVTSFQICATRCLDVLAWIAPFLRQPGGGVCQDYGVYFLTGLVNLLGPIEQVMAVMENRSEQRINRDPDSPHFGEAVYYPNDSHVEAILRTKSGVMGTLSLNGDSIIKDVGYFHIYGTEGMISLPNCNEFTGQSIFVPQPKDYFSPIEEVALPHSYTLPENGRGIGIADMVDAIETGRAHRACDELAYHVLDVILCMEKSSASGRFETVHSTCSVPALLTSETVEKLCD